MAGHTTFSILVKPPGFFFQGGDHSSSEEDLFIDEGKTYSEEELCGDDYFNGGDEDVDWFTGDDEFFGSAQRDTPANFDTFFTEQLNYF